MNKTRRNSICNIISPHLITSVKSVGRSPTLLSAFEMSNYGVVAMFQNLLQGQKTSPTFYLFQSKMAFAQERLKLGGFIHSKE